MKKVLLMAVLFVTGCSMFDEASYHRGAPGYLKIEKSMYDKSKTINLKPVSLFDPDNSVSIFRLGFYWETKMKDEAYIIINIPVGGVIEYENIKSNIGDLLIKNGNERIVLKKSEQAVAVSEKNIVIIKEYDLQIRYIGSLSLIQSLLKSKDVVVKVSLPDKTYEGRFDLNNKARERFRNKRNNAFNGASRFIEAVHKQK